jgi:hypothetical protein
MVCDDLFLFLFFECNGYRKILIESMLQLKISEIGTRVCAKGWTSTGQNMDSLDRTAVSVRNYLFIASKMA